MVNMVELQNKLLDMLKWFHEFCVDNDLTYYLSGGTMLGAARHQGIIPWDDDVDVMMPREDIKKMEKLLGDSLGRYVLEAPTTEAKDFLYPYHKIYDTTTTLVENNKHKTKRGIFIDVFSIDGIGNTPVDVEKHLTKIRKKYNLLLCKVATPRKGRKWYKNAAVLFFKFIPIKEKKLLRNIIMLCEEQSYDLCELCGISVGAYKSKEIMPKSIYGKPTLYKFGDFEVFGVEHPDEYLTRLYGDWRTPPPEDKRVSEHNFLFIDLNKSYLEI